MRNNIRIYEVKSEYIKYLSNYQKHIFSQTDEKSNRKYIGIIFEIKGIKYFAPLSSYKDKHKQMKERVDIIKIKSYAVINLNNMIPVPDSQIINIDINKEKNASYRYLLQAESREVNKQKGLIRKNAEIVYTHKKFNGVSTPLAKRTNDFKLLEKLCREYR
ncbi:MAG: type III toxin-antitoxin system ToxN/AbiQ family toxin [Lachnospiraceae bacterium]|nr:type III toxin-antitoxin system ToxN/AbiQ family toxin [Lachnospiraceae bacterium]